MLMKRKIFWQFFSKEKNSKSKYSNCVYLKNYKVLKSICCDLEEKVSVKIFNDLDKNKTTQI